MSGLLPGRNPVQNAVNGGVVEAESKHDKSPLREICAELHTKVSAFLQTSFEEDELLRRTQERTKHSLGVVDEALKNYSLDQISISYNGGKDCLVLLVLFLAALSKHTCLPTRIQSVYIIAPHPFAEVDKFVESSTEAYCLDLTSYSKPMKQAFDLYLQEHPKVKAIFVGTRRSDPHGANLTSFDKTDHGWPDFMRVHPVIDWEYAEIWAFIRYLEIPYCSLYDLGYTSLGGTRDTHPNPALRAPESGSDSSNARDKFRPAYELKEPEKERFGRDA